MIEPRLDPKLVKNLRTDHANAKPELFAYSSQIPELTSLDGPIEKSEIRSINIIAWRDLEAKRAGGSEVHAHEIAKRFAAKGISVKMRTAGSKELEKLGFRNHYMVERLGGPYTVFARVLSAGILGRLTKCDALIEIWNGMPFFSPIWAGDIPKVIILHHIHGLSFWKHVLPPPLAQLGAMAEKKIFPALYKNQILITPSSSTAQEVIETMKWPESLVHIVHPGINPIFYPKGEKSANPIMVAVGRLVPTKHFDEIIKITIGLRRNIPDLELFILGDGPCREELQELIVVNGAQDYIKLLGKVSDETLVEYYRRAWIVVSASEKEGWGMSLTEAAACGTPAVAFRIPGHIDAVIHGMSGFLANTKNELIRGISEILLNPNLRERLSNGALIHASSMTWDNTAYAVFAALCNAKNLKTDKKGYTLLPLKIERRVAARYNCNVECSIGSHKGLVKDISVSGILIAVPERLGIENKSNRVKVTIHTKKGNILLEGLIIRHVSKDRLEYYGIKFDSYNSPYELLRSILS